MATELVNMMPGQPADHNRAGQSSRFQQLDMFEETNPLHHLTASFKGSTVTRCITVCYSQLGGDVVGGLQLAARRKGTHVSQLHPRSCR